MIVATYHHTSKSPNLMRVFAPLKSLLPTIFQNLSTFWGKNETERVACKENVKQRKTLDTAKLNRHMKMRKP